ncbi:MAG: carboxypeptidase regulatory-like domain-containing protein, partial [Candidatus Stahlbacteria bacterium]|nr:carboxypeptidase regulatory-like domain-containing protein [Candidatus Stahlbacteria bacterium]
MIKIYGKVTDFNDTPIKDAEIEIKDKNFGTIYQTFSDTEGK